MGRTAYEVERDRFGVTYSGPLEVGECISVVPLAEHEALRTAARELLELAEGYHDYISKITGDVDGFLVLDRAREALDG